MNTKIEFIRSAQIIEGLKDTHRQYLLGDLKQSQEISQIFDKNVEVGITKYSKHEYEEAHYHINATEYHFMISGYTKYLDIDTSEEYEFRKGDFFVIRPYTKYAQKSKKGTEILFVKFPAGNDKTKISESDKIFHWLNDKIITTRIDHYYNKNAPVANSIKPAVAVALIKAESILMLRRKDSGNWTLPGGTHEYGENLIQTGIREIKEEVGVDIQIDTLVATYSDPNVLIEYNDGEIRQEFTFLYMGHVLGGKFQIDEESFEMKWINFSDYLQFPMALSQKRRIEDLIKFLMDGKIILK